MGTGEPSRSPLVATIATALSRRNNSSQNSRSNWGGSPVGNHSAESATELQTAPLSPVYRAPTGNLAANEQSGTNLKDTRGCTLLHLSCQIGDLSLIELLLQHGARVNITDAQGRTPLHYCILSNRNLCAKLLLTRYFVERHSTFASDIVRTSKQLYFQSLWAISLLSMQVVKANVLALIVRSCVTLKVCPKKILFKSYPCLTFQFLAFAEGLIQQQQTVWGRLLWRVQWSKGPSQMMNSLSCCLNQVDSLFLSCHLIL